MKLQELLGEELYSQVQAKLDEVNGKEPDKLKHVRYADLSEGEYISKAKFDGLEAENNTNAQKLSEANKLIDQLQKAAKGSQEVQQKVEEYKTQAEKLEAQLAQAKLDAAIQVGLLSEHATDLDYLTYKLKTGDDKLELDENGKIKGWEEKVSALKTQYPGQFETAGGKEGYEGFRPLPKNQRREEGSPEPRSLAEALKQKYQPNQA